MNKLLIVGLVIVLSSCGGKLTDEERKKLHEGMATQEIKRIPEADILAAATKYAQSVYTDVEKIDKTLGKKAKIDSIAAARSVKIYPLIPDDKTLRAIEQSLVEAYISGSTPELAGDNLQRIGEDSLLFTKPVFKERPDGSQQFSHAIGIKMAKSTIVATIPSI